MQKFKTPFAVLLAVIMIFSLAMPAFAEEPETEGCGFVQAVEGAECTHVHDEGCGFAEAAEGVEGAECTHSHDETCGFVQAVEGAECAHAHGEGCGFAEAVPGAECTHSHDENCCPAPHGIFLQNDGGMNEPMAAAPFSATSIVQADGALDFTASEADNDASGSGWSWNAAEKTLTLNGIDLTTTSSTYGISLPSSSTIVLEGVNNVTANYYREGFGMGANGISALDTLTIKGDGELNASGANSGIYVNPTDASISIVSLDIYSGTINASAHITANGIGICVSYRYNNVISEINIHGGKVSGSAKRTGISAKKLTVTGGEVTATGTGNKSRGLNISNSISLNNCMLKATGGATAIEKTDAMVISGIQSISASENGTDFIQISENELITALTDDDLIYKSIKFVPAAAPTAPQNLAATPGNAQVQLNWDEPENNGGSDIIKYEVSFDGGTTWVDAGLNTEYLFTGLTNGTEYTFNVRAVNDVGNSEDATVKATPFVETDAEEPVITTHPQNAAYKKDATATPLTVEASVTDGGTLSYQWHSNSNTDSIGDAIPDATEASYTPSTETVGTTYYSVVVTNTLNGNTATATSNFAAIVVTNDNPSPEHDPIIAPDPNVGIAVNEQLLVSFKGELSSFMRVSLNGAVMETTPAPDGTHLLINWPGKDDVYCGEIHSGSVVIKFYPEYLATLPDGTYELKAYFNDNGVENSGQLAFKIGAPPAPAPAPAGATSPKTGDNANSPLWVILGLMSFAAILASAVLVYKNKFAKTKEQ